MLGGEGRRSSSEARGPVAFEKEGLNEVVRVEPPIPDIFAIEATTY
jgi:hypothetical protein